MIKNLLCKIGFHFWEYKNPLCRTCQNCPRTESFHVLAFRWEAWDEKIQIDHISEK